MRYDIATEGDTIRTVRIKDTDSEGKVKRAVKLELTNSLDEQVTYAFWIPENQEDREALANAFEHMASLINSAPTES